MKPKLILPAILISLLALSSCEKYLGGSSIGGTLSPMGDVGTTYSSSYAEISGVSDFEASVTSVDNKDVSTFTGSATVKNAGIKAILSNFPEIQISGDRVTATGIQFKNTSEGMESVSGLDPGIIVKYGAKVGDTYTTDSGKKRTVTSVSTSDDFPYGFMLIKVTKVEEPTNSFGVSKITYWANHKWGLVRIEFQFDDGSTTTFPVYCSTNN